MVPIDLVIFSVSSAVREIEIDIEPPILSTGSRRWWKNSCNLISIARDREGSLGDLPDRRREGPGDGAVRHHVAEVEQRQQETQHGSGAGEDGAARRRTPFQLQVLAGRGGADRRNEGSGQEGGDVERGSRRSVLGWVEEISIARFSACREGF